jgi:hypothetical protein
MRVDRERHQRVSAGKESLIIYILSLGTECICEARVEGCQRCAKGRRGHERQNSDEIILEVSSDSGSEGLAAAEGIYTQFDDEVAAI